MAGATAPASLRHDVAPGRGFEFGRNWARFLQVVDDERIEEAMRSLRNMLGREDLAGLSFVDVGAGSGLFSLAAARLDAARVHSFDRDPGCVRCAEILRQRHAAATTSWTIELGNVCDRDYVRSLGRFDVVYAWGVLHHTGDMWSGLDNVIDAVDDGGRLFVAIYNDQGLKSRLWRVAKRLYNTLPVPLRLPYALLAMAPREILLALTALIRGHPGEYTRSWTEYKRRRGQSRWHDLIDWIGGYPFQVAAPDAVFDFVRRRGFTLDRLKTCGGSLGCNEYVFTRGGGGSRPGAGHP